MLGKVLRLVAEEEVVQQELFLYLYTTSCLFPNEVLFAIEKVRIGGKFAFQPIHLGEFGALHLLWKNVSMGSLFGYATHFVG